MQINLRTKGVIITSKQKSQMERQIQRLKRYLKDVSPIVVDVTLIDESGPEKGGIDQAVHINAMLPKEKIFIEEVDDRITRAFGFALKTFERRLRRYHQKTIDKDREQAGMLKRAAGVVGSAGSALGRLVPRRRGNKR